MSEKKQQHTNSHDRALHYLWSKKILGKSGHDIFCQFSGLVNGTRLAPFFCLILMKKGQKTTRKAKKQQQLLTLSCILVDSQIKTKNTTKTFWRQICYRAPICLYFLSFFLPHLPTYPPTHKCSTRPAQMRAKKQLTLISSF